MEISSKFKERDTNTSPLNSPNSHGLNSLASCSNSTANGNGNGNGNPSSIPITRSDPNSPYPTTFVTADTSSFKQVVQMLTGSSETTTPKNQQHHENSSNNNNTASTCCSSSSSKNFVIPPIKTGPKKQGFKLYERRNSIKNLISPLTAAAVAGNHHTNFSLQNASFSPRHKQDMLSPSLLDFPSLTLSPVTPLVEDPFNKSSSSSSSIVASSEEDKAIAEKGFYLHPSPISTPRDSQPQLLPLFPLSSPRVSQP